MHIAHMASVMCSQFLSFLLSTGGVGAWVSGKVHCEHILPGGELFRKVHSEHILATKSAHACGGWGVWVSKKVLSEHKSAHAHGGEVSGKVHSEHILATKVLMLWGGGVWVSRTVHFEHKSAHAHGRGGVWESAQ